MNNLQAILALRNHLLSLQFAGTGVTTLAATGTGYTRATGSFITDGFVRGMEVVPAGFANNVPAIILSVTALEIRTRTAHPVEAANAGRSLTVGIPPLRAWELVSFAPIDGRWHIEEDYIPGMQTRVGVGRNSQVNHDPMYVIRLNGLSGDGVTGLYTVADGILAGFPLGYDIAMPDGKPLMVGGNPGPYRTQALPDSEDSSRAEIVITIPLWKRTNNPI